MSTTANISVLEMLERGEVELVEGREKELLDVSWEAFHLLVPLLSSLQPTNPRYSPTSAALHYLTSHSSPKEVFMMALERLQLVKECSKRERELLVQLVGEGK